MPCQLIRLITSDSIRSPSVSQKEDQKKGGLLRHPGHPFGGSVGFLHPFRTVVHVVFHFVLVLCRFV